jgi:hypothetical protein
MLSRSMVLSFIPRKPIVVRGTTRAHGWSHTIDRMWMGSATVAMAFLVTAAPLTSLAGIGYTEPVKWGATAAGAIVGAIAGRLGLFGR